MADALIELDGMSSGYGGVPVVRDLNLHVDPGEVVALLGPNGAGKTTTLLTISGIVKVLDGSANVFGAAGGLRLPSQDGPARHGPRAGGSLAVLRADRGREPQARATWRA